MRNIDQALDDISSIRSQVAAGTLFRGFGPTVMAVTGLLAVMTGGAQSLWPQTLAAGPMSFYGCWFVTALVAGGLIGAEMSARSRRHHGGLADAMIWNAVEQFLPALVAGIALAGVLLKFSPAQSWMLPGLWQMLVALGLFASARSLPRTIMLVAAWYFLAGVTGLVLGSFNQDLSPWLMAVPFAAGQGLMAAVLYFACGEEP
ncbi:MAG: hypothetical protein ACLFWF_14385 [Alphaproteobacteria bacterium]